MPIPDNYIAGAILVLGILLTIWCVIKGEGYAKQIKWILIFFSLISFVVSDKFDTFNGFKVLADLTNVNRYVGQLKEVTADSIQKLNETYASKLEKFQAVSSAEGKHSEKLAREAKTLMRLSLESVVYNEAIRTNKDIIRTRIKNVAPVLFNNKSERDQWIKNMLRTLNN